MTKEKAINSANNLAASLDKPMQVVREDLTGVYMVFGARNNLALGYSQVYVTEG